MAKHLEQPTASVITPPGEGGIGIIALRGRGTPELLDRFFTGVTHCASDLPAGRIAYGHIVQDGRILDEVIIARFDAEWPQYEINCHGGVMAVQAVLNCLHKAGASVVEWQSLDKIRCSPKEGALSEQNIRDAALSALPRAETRLAARMLLHQADGVLFNAIKKIRDEISEGVSQKLDELLSTAGTGQALLSPPTVMLAGPPNAGKSSLLNALLKRERVIVHDRPGTTRDIVRDTVAINGLPFEVIDSAGIRWGNHHIECKTVERGLNLMKECDVLILIFDARESADDLLNCIPDLPEKPRQILVGNKIDLCTGDRISKNLPDKLRSMPSLCLSARTGQGVERLEAELLRPYEPHLSTCRKGTPMVFSSQIEDVLRRVKASLERGGPAAALGELHEAGVAPFYMG